MKSRVVHIFRCQRLIERRVEFDVTFLQASQVSELVVGDSILPTAPEDSHPFEGNDPQGAERRFSLSPLILKEELGPGTMLERTFGKFHQGLVNKLRSRPTEKHDQLFAALFFDWSHAGAAQEIQRAGPILARRSKQRRQARCQDRACSGQFRKKPGLAMILENAVDLLIVLFDERAQASQLFGQAQRLQLQWLYNSLIFRQRHRTLDSLQTLPDLFLRTAVVTIEEGPQHSGFSSFQGGQIWPAPQKLPSHSTLQILFEQLDEQRIVALEHSALLIEKRRMLIHKAAAAFHQQAQLAGGWILHLQGTQPRLMLQPHFAQQLGVARIGFGAAHTESSAEVGQTAGIDRIDDQKVILHQRIEKRSPALFQANADQALGMLLAQAQEGLIQQLRLLLQEVRLGRPLERLHNQTMLLVSPISTDPGPDRVGNCRARLTDHCILRCGVVLYFCLFHRILLLASRKDLDDRKPYRGLVKRKPLSVRIDPKNMAGSESLSRCLEDMGRVVRHPSRVTLLLEAQTRVVHNSKLFAAKVIHSRLRGVIPGRLSSPPMNHFGTPITGQQTGHGLSKLPSFTLFDAWFTGGPAGRSSVPASPILSRPPGGRAHSPILRKLDHLLKTSNSPFQVPRMLL